jgi:Zn-dependent protease with chaperone function
VIPPAWYAPLPSFLWQVALHSAIMGLIFYGWATRLGLPSGRAKRRLLALLLVLPFLTASVPGRTGLEFRERVAWLDSGRLLAVPLPWGLRVHHAVLLGAAMVVVLTVWQELLPALRRRGSATAAVPDALVRIVRSLPGWGRCRIAVAPADAITLATAGWPWRPRVIVSRGALRALGPEELAIALRHENAHWQGNRWARSHALFLVRLLQCYNPVALWAFREYCLEVEIECDAEAAGGGAARLLAGTLLKIYEATDRRDLATRAALRKRVDVLLGGGLRDDALPRASIAVAAALLLVTLPWIV